MVLRVRPTPTGLPTNILFTLAGSILLMPEGKVVGVVVVVVV